MRSAWRFLPFPTLIVVAFSLLEPVTADHSSYVHSTDWGPAIRNVRLPAQVVGNTGSTYYEVGGFDADAVSALPTAVQEWNDELRSAPNSLTKSVFTHISSYNFNPSSDIQVRIVQDAEDLVPVCGRVALGCMRDNNDIGQPTTDLAILPFHVYVSLRDEDGEFLLSPDAVLLHELGHALQFTEHFNSAFDCDPDWDSVMDAYSCDGSSVEDHDESDFFDAYKPRRAPTPTSMTIVSNSQVDWTWAVSQPFPHNISRYNPQALSDRNGSVLVNTFTYAIPELGTPYNSVRYTLGTGGGTNSRFCARTTGIMDGGYQGLNAVTPFTPHGCASRSLSPYSTSFMATSHVAGSSIVVTARNGQSSTRYMQITGPGLENLGTCSNTAYRSISPGGTKTCSVSYSTADNYDRLAVFIWSSSTGGTLLSAIPLDTDAR